MFEDELENPKLDAKPDLKGYKNWFSEHTGSEITTISSNVYEFVMSKLGRDFESSDFWQGLNTNLANFNDEYFLMHDYPLFKDVSPVPIFTKPYGSLVEKSYRKNVLNNKRFPSEPDSGWITPSNWFTSVGDLLRTTITVKYLDGVEFLAEKIKQLSAEHDFDFHVDYEAREEGYYAAHITVTGPFTIVDEDWKEIEIPFSMEIQITTQLQEVIKGLLHKMYEDTRVSASKKEVKWQWDHKSLEFSSNYLGHILHYVEGMILEVRDKQKLNTTENEEEI